MVCRISDYIVTRMLELKVIDSDDREYYIYKLCVMCETAVTVFTLLVISMIMRRPDVMIVFLLAYTALRRYAGGLHLDSFSKCYFTSIIVFSGVIYIIPKLSPDIYLISLTLLSALVIAFIGTVNHPNLNLDPDELKITKRKTRISVFAECMILVALRIFGLCETYLISLAMAIIICGFLMIAAKLIKQEVK